MTGDVLRRDVFYGREVKRRRQVMSLRSPVVLLRQRGRVWSSFCILNEVTKKHVTCTASLYLFLGNDVLKQAIVCIIML